MKMDENCYSNTGCIREAVKSSRRKCNDDLVCLQERRGVMDTHLHTRCRVHGACQLIQQATTDQHCRISKTLTQQKQTCTATDSHTQQLHHAKQHLRLIQSQRNSTPCRSKPKIFHHLIAVILLVVLTLAAPTCAQGTAKSSQALSQSPSGSEIFYSPESWSIEELDTVETVAEEPLLRMTHTSANVGYLFRARIISAHDSDETNEQITSFQFKVTFDNYNYHVHVHVQ